jgi:phage terminase large subunit
LQNLENLTPEQLTAISQVLEIAQTESKDPQRFKGMENEPRKFVTEVLGLTLWEKQFQILEAARDHRRVAIRSGHSVGKTFAVASLVLWWLYARQGLVLTTAPTWDHVEGVLWREINSIAGRATVPLPGEPFLTERRVSNDWKAFGLSTNNPDAFRGWHHPRLLVVIDEASGVDELIHTEISTLCTGQENCIVMIGNPTSTSGTFYNAFAKQGPWHRLHISCLEHPNVISGVEGIKGAVTTQWVEDARSQWGEQHPFWFSRVLGVFPMISNKGVIPLAWVERAINEDKRKEALDQAELDRIPRVGGLDVARYGDNRTVFIVRRGDAVEHIESWHHTSLMETTGRAKRLIDEFKLKALVVDSAGVGGGVVDRLLEQHAPVFAYNGGHRAFTQGQFANRRSELWWSLRQRFEHQKMWLPKNHDILTGELIAPQYDITSAGRLRVETKESLLDRGIASPDFADALVMSFALDEDPEAFLSAPKAHGQDPWEGIEIELQKESDFGQFPDGF